MEFKEKELNFRNISNDLDNISKKLYLESPEIWVDFSDKIGEETLDEMVLFYAAKFNYTSIIKYAIANNIIDLSIPSKNKNYTSIKDHLLAVSKDYKNNEVYSYLSGECTSFQNNEEEKVDESIDRKQEETNENYFPIFICKHCNSNIFKSGYKVYEEINFVYSQNKEKSEELSRKKDNRVFCNNCNKIIDNTTTELLENICSIHNCNKCGKNLTQIGITEKINMEFNNNKFIGKQKTYNCSSCDEKLYKSQIKYFNL